MDNIINNGGTPLMPPVGDADYIIGYWQALGMATPNGMGSAPLSASEISHWSQLSGIELAPFEYTSIVDMSRHYLSSMQQGAKPDFPPPYGDPVSEFDRTKVATKISNAFKAFIGAKRK